MVNFLITLLVVLFTLVAPSIVNVECQNTQIEAIYQFGDSISATGRWAGCNKRPYGRTFFQYPTGRCSDGLLMIDYFAHYFKLPLINPYFKKNGNFSNGVNFAVAGAPALNITRNRYSLLVQLGWFKSYLANICSNPSECKQKLENALFFVGEIGGNDYNNLAFEKRKTMKDLRNMVPYVVQTISNVVKEVIDLGATRVVVPGNFPVGCMTVYLQVFQSNDSTMYDEFGCLKNWNDFATFHNDQLKSAIQTLQDQNSGVKIVYGDYFSALISLIQNASTLGFDKNELFKACCGTGDEKYNFDRRRGCGSQGILTSCPDPSARISWDGVHLTQHAYQFMADQLLKQITQVL